MNTNDPRDEAILNLASAIHHINMNRRSRDLAALAEFAISNAKLRDRVEESMLIAAEAGHATEASALVAKHMPTNVSTFGGSDAVFGWTGTDAAGNRVSWKVEPAEAATGKPGESAKQLTDEALVLNELRAIRAELKAVRKHSGARIVPVADSERFAHIPPPTGAKNGEWLAVVGSALPVWVESAPMEYDPAAGVVKPSAPAVTEAAGLRI
nr:hypothetical protein [uncultured Duganella sp.]